MTRVRSTPAWPGAVPSAVRRRELFAVSWQIELQLREQPRQSQNLRQTLMRICYRPGQEGTTTATKAGRLFGTGPNGWANPGFNGWTNPGFNRWANPGLNRWANRQDLIPELA
jgi:hypothetical protein